MKIALSIFPTENLIQPVLLGREAEARGFELAFAVANTPIPASWKTSNPMGGELLSIPFTS